MSGPSQSGAMLYTQGFGSRPENVEIPHLDVRAPSISDVNYPIGKRWIVSGTSEYTLVSQSSIGGILISNWLLLGVSGGALATITGDSGTATPVTGNINILGTANQISTLGSGDDITISLPSAITVPGSLTTTTSLAVGTNATIGGTLGVTGITTLAALSATTGTFSGAISGGTTITAGTGIVSTTGNIQATAGNLLLPGGGTQIRIEGGAATDFVGTVTLVSGSSGAIANTNIAATDRIIPFRISINGSTAIGVGFSYTISAGASFTILSLNAAAATETNDNSIIGYFIFRQL